jgi:DNA-binding NarL/FixJ family response regulator
VLALEAIHRGEKVVSPVPSRRQVPASLDWPGRQQGLSSREAEIVALVTQGHGNAEIAERMCLSINSVKTYIRSAYRKMGVTNRAQAVLWGVDHGFRPPHRALEAWRST